MSAARNCSGVEVVVWCRWIVDMCSPSPRRVLGLDVALPLPDLRRVRLEVLDEVDDEAAQLDQRLIADRVLEEQLVVDSPDRDKRDVGRRSPECEEEVDHRSNGAGSGKEPVQGLGIEADRWI